MKSSAKNIKLTSYDDLFEPSNPAQSELAEKIIEIPLSELHSFKNHPFQVRDDDTKADIPQPITRICNDSSRFYPGRI